MTSAPGTEENASRRFVRVPWYVAVVFALTVITTPPGVLYAAVKISDQKAQAAIREAERRDCDELRDDLDVYALNPPSTDAGIALEERKTLRYSQRGCLPLR